MILDKLGVLSRAQSISATAADTTNVIQLSAVDYANLTDVWLVVDTAVVATGDAADTYTFQLVASQESTLDTNIEILSRTITGYASAELATAGNRFLSVNVGKMIKDVLGASGSDYVYIGGITTVSAGGAWSINASISPFEPPTDSHRQVVTSNVGIPTRVSAGS